MGLLQKAVETYDAHAHLAGVVSADRQPLAPVSHTITSAAIEITLDETGQLLNMSAVSKDEPKIIIPVTEGSAGRSIKPCPHPLCEQIGYLSGEDETKFQLYTEQLARWEASAHSHPMLAPILRYVRSQTILRDLETYKIKKDDKALVRWRVIGLDESQSSACWTNRALFDAFTAWYAEEISSRGQALCMISGKWETPAIQHPKGIIPIKGNAKLISANDTHGFTYRGRFTDDTQAVTVSYTASQKAHNALRWLVADQGVQTELGGGPRPQQFGTRAVFGGRTFLCWNPQGKKVPHCASPLIPAAAPITQPTDYQRALQHALYGYRTELPVGCGGVIIAAFDAATTGRLSLTYYNELQAADFLDRLYDWDRSCCWWSWNPAEKRYTIQTPTLWRIMNCAFGALRSGRLETDERQIPQQMQRLLTCRVDRAMLPLDIKRALVNRASNPQSYPAEVHRNILFTACAVIKKYDHDHHREEWKMALEKDKKDRSYQFGRLLAIMEKAERDTYTNGETRQPNAMRYMSVFCKAPYHIACNLDKQLKKAYWPRLKPGTQVFYDNLIQDIFDNLSNYPQSEWNMKLADSYLMGYYLQRRELYLPKEQKEQEEN